MNERILLMLKIHEDLLNCVSNKELLENKATETLKGLARGLDCGVCGEDLESLSYLYTSVKNRMTSLGMNIKEYDEQFHILMLSREKINSDYIQKLKNEKKI